MGTASATQFLHDGGGIPRIEEQRIGHGAQTHGLRDRVRALHMDHRHHHDIGVLRAKAGELVVWQCVDELNDSGNGALKLLADRGGGQSRREQHGRGA